MMQKMVMDRRDGDHGSADGDDNTNMLTPLAPTA